jgi:hypothetical protein
MKVASARERKMFGSNQKYRPFDKLTFALPRQHQCNSDHICRMRVALQFEIFLADARDKNVLCHRERKCLGSKHENRAAAM